MHWNLKEVVIKYQVLHKYFRSSIKVITSCLLNSIFVIFSHHLKSSRYVFYREQWKREDHIYERIYASNQGLIHKYGSNKNYNKNFNFNLKFTRTCLCTRFLSVIFAFLFRSVYNWFLGNKLCELERNHDNYFLSSSDI